MKNLLRRIAPVVWLSRILFPYRDWLRALLRTAFGQRAYSQNYFERLFEARTDPWQYAGEHQRERLDLLLSSVPGQARTALEIGCAEGAFTSLLKERVADVIALDLPLVALRRARQRCAPRAISFVQGDAARLPFQGSFDLIVCAGVLVYFPEQELLARSISRIAALMAPGGVLVVENMWDRSGGAIDGRRIHDLICAREELRLVKLTHHMEYAISVFQKTAGPVPREGSL